MIFRSHGTLRRVPPCKTFRIVSIRLDNTPTPRRLRYNSRRPLSYQQIAHILARYVTRHDGQTYCATQALLQKRVSVSLILFAKKALRRAYLHGCFTQQGFQSNHLDWNSDSLGRLTRSPGRGAAGLCHNQQIKPASDVSHTTTLTLCFRPSNRPSVRYKPDRDDFVPTKLSLRNM